MKKSSLIPILIVSLLSACGGSSTTSKTPSTTSNHAPSVSNVSINGNIKAGELVTLEYTFFDEDNDTEGNSIIIWATPSKTLQRGTSRSLLMPANYEGETLSAWVVPADKKGLQGQQLAADNNGLKVLTLYEEAVILPKYDQNNPKMLLIESAADWGNINNPDINYFFVKPGDYSSAGTEQYGRIKLTASGTAQSKRYIVLHNGNNTHAGKLNRSQLAKVGFILQGANHWVIDRMSYWDSPTATNPIIVKESSHNVFNRLYFHDVGNGLYIYPSSHENIVQNSRIERDNISIFHDRAAIGLFNNHQPDALIKNTKIVNNEVRNFVDGVQTIRMNIDKTPDNNFEGTIIDNNHFYIDKTIYTDCHGNHDENGSCSYAENALDLKIGSANINNPMIISNNMMWGFRKSDTTNSTLGDSGALMPVHYGVNHTVIKNNIGFDSAEGFSIGDPRYGASIRNSLIENNTFQDIKGMAIFVADSQHLEVKDNLFKNIGKDHPYHWIAAYNNENLTFNKNLTVSTNNRSARLNSNHVNFVASDNQYFDSIYAQFADTINGSDTPLESDPTDNYKDLTFTTDRYTNHPRTITVPKVIKP